MLTAYRARCWTKLWMEIAVVCLLLLGTKRDAHLTAIHSVSVDLEALVKRSDLIAIVSPVARQQGVKEGRPEFELVKILHASGPETKVPKRLAVGPSHHGIASVSPPRRDPSGYEESPVVYRYSSPSGAEQLARARQVIVFLDAASSGREPYRFAVDDAVESITRLAEVQALIARLKPAEAPATAPAKPSGRP